MRIQSTRDIGQLWLASGAVFLASVSVTRLLGRSEQARMPSLWIGYLGLAAIGLALVLTWRWLDRGGPRSFVGRALLRLALSAAFVFWGLAILFPWL